jgi:uncharacterized membrane protein YdbT with pleckstrin-like domain
MGRYVDEILQPGEQLRYSTTVHAIVYAPGLICLALAAAALIGAWSTHEGTLIAGLIGVAAVLAAIGLVWLAGAWFRRWTTETDVTSLRVVHKEGFIKRRTFEMSLDKVESVDVYQSIPGRIFNWGNVQVNGVGKGNETIKMIASPLQFRNHITAH